jgi:hypothetical protein
MKTVWSVLYEEITTVYCDNDRDRVFKFLGENSEFVNVLIVVIYVQ